MIDLAKNDPRPSQANHSVHGQARARTPRASPPARSHAPAVQAAAGRLPLDTASTLLAAIASGDCAPRRCAHVRVALCACAQTFTEWFVDDYLFGPNGGSNPNISGFVRG